MSEHPNKQALILDSTQIDAYLTCPQLWDYSYNQRLTAYAGRPKDAMLMGSYGHGILDLYYKSLAAGSSQSKAIEEGLSFDPSIHLAKCICGCSRKAHFFYVDNVPAIINCTNCTNCTRFNAAPVELEQLTQANCLTVQDRLATYFFKWKDNDIKPDSPDSVEVGFSYKLFEDDRRLYILEGRIDVLGSIQGLACIADHKFQTRRHDLYKKSIQFRNYCLAAGKLTLIVNYIRLTKTIDKDTLVREAVSFNPMELKAWKDELINVYDDIARSKRNRTYNLNRSACSGKYGYNCEFTPLCEHSYDSGLVQLKIAAQYKQKEEWKPW